MRAILLSIAAGMCSLALAQTGAGIYTPKGGTPQPWQINPNHSLIWNSAAYLPVGLRIDGTPAEVARARAAGFSDVIVELPAGGTGWSDCIKALEAAQVRYLISINSLAPMAEGVAIEPAGYRVTGVTKAQKMDVKLPGASAALVVIVNRRDGSVSSTQRFSVENGTLTMDVKPYADLERILLIYPRMRSLEQPDLWEALDEHRDRLLHTLGTFSPGAGLRGIVNPFGRVAPWDRSEPHFVPTSPYYRYELATYLKQKYKSLETAMKAWSMTTSDIDSFEKLARLAPLWSGGTRGISQLWDTDSDKLYTCNSSKSLAWPDIQEVIASAFARRSERLVEAIQKVTDVPVVQEWAGWSPLYETRTPAVDGIGMKAAGTSPSAILDSASRATSSTLRWKGASWLVATEVDPGSEEGAAGQVGAVLDDLQSLGARGWFLRNANDAVVKAFSNQVTRSGDISVTQYAPLAVYFPENAANPAVPQLLPGGRWWLPSPASGNRLDFSSQIFGYRYVDGGQSFTAIWTNAPTQRVKLFMLDAKPATFMSLDGSPPNPKNVRGGVEVNLGQIPLIISGTDEIPIPEPAYAETLFRMDQLFNVADATMVDVTQPRYLFKDALAGFERNPGGSYSVMRQQFDRLTLRFGRFMWTEAESSKSNNFSEVLKHPACSGGSCLSLRTQIASPSDGYFADFVVPVKSNDDVEVWVAARIPEDQRKNVTVTIAGETFPIQVEPVSLYGPGFGWYKIGTTRLGGGQTKMRIQVTGQSADLAIDNVVLFPGVFQPRGATLPDAIVYPPTKKIKPN